MVKYIRIYTESKSMNSYYYEEQTGEMFILEQNKGGNGLSVGIIAGISLVIYAFVRKIEKPISFDANLLYWISVGIGVALGVLIAGYMLIIAGISLVIYAFVRKIEKPISFDANLLYWISVGIGVALGVLIAGYMLKRAKRKIEKNVRIYPCGLEEKQAMAKQNHRYFFTYIFLILVMVGICAVSHFLMIWVVPSVLPCGLEEKQAMAKQNHRYFFTYIFLILVMVGICAVSHFLMIWVVPSVLIYAFFNSLMCLLTILLTIAFIGNHPIKGWKIASRILRGER